MIRWVFVACIALAGAAHSAQPPQASLDDLIAKAPPEVQQYCKLGRSIRQRLHVAADHRLVEARDELAAMQRGRLNPDYWKKTGTAHSPWSAEHEERIAPGVRRYKSRTGQVVYEFQDREARQRTILAHKGQIPILEAQVRAMADENKMIRPRIHPCAEAPDGAAGNLTNEHDEARSCGRLSAEGGRSVLIMPSHRMIVSQVIDANTVLVELSSSYGQGYEHERLIWCTGVDTTALHDGQPAPIEHIPFIVDGNRTFTTVLGATRTVQVFRALDVDSFVGPEWFTAP